MFQEKLTELRPYVTGIRFVKDLPVVDVVLMENWDMFESDQITYKPSSIDSVLNHVEYVIDFNIEKENKLTLLKAKIEELKMLFSDKSLKELEKLKFVIESIEEPTLKDIKTNETSNKTHNGIELPPTKSNEKVIEKEEV
jgi:hypothetical protein